MEFNYRAIGEHASPYSHFTEQSVRGGYLGPPGNDFQKQRERDAILIELEKQRIREERIAEEIDRKRALEELLRRGSNGGRESSIDFTYHYRESLAGERAGMSLEKWLGIRAAARQGTAPYPCRVLKIMK